MSGRHDPSRAASGWDGEPGPDVLRACRSGDRAALESVLLPHAPAIERLLCRLVGPSPDVQDLLQHTLAEAIIAFPRFRGEARVSTWLCGIATHVAQRWLRNPDRRRVATLAVVPEPGNGAADDQATAIDGRRLVARLYEVLDLVSPKKRIAFVLHVLEERPIEEVAALMGASRTATKSRIYWARRELVKAVARDPLLRTMLEGKGAAR